jgi:hypothetical protein
MADTPAQLLTDRLLAGRYRLIRLVGRGGMAQVWEAQDDVLARLVAVKVLHPHLATDPDFLERFRREAIAAARLHSPHVVATYDAGTDTAPFIVMELVRGRNLRQLLSALGQLPLDMALSIGIQVCEAVAAAHAVGLVHRDIKPANILICEEPPFVVESPLIKVTDFGVARMVDTAGSDLTHTGMLVGTAAYLAPEQVEGRSGDARSDVYSVGVVLHEMIAGIPPYQGETELATALQHLNASPPALRERRAGVPPALEAIVSLALSRKPEDRFASALELRSALAALDSTLAGLTEASAVPAPAAPAPAPAPTPAALAPTQIVARPQAPPSRLRAPRPSRRWAILVAASVLAVGAVGAGLILAGAGKPAGQRAGAGVPSTSPTPGGNGSTVAVEGVSLLDSPGSDNAPEIGNVVDGNPATVWMSSYYATAPFGNLKDGIGVILNLGQSHRLQKLVVDSSTAGWAATVYAAARPAGKLSAWGAPVTSASGIDGSHTFALDGHPGGAVLLWITTPGNTAPWSNRMAIQELTVSGS